VPLVHDEAAAPADEEVIDDRAWRWTVRVLYTTLIAAELWVLFDWWRTTPAGQDTLARCRQRIEAAKRRAQECEGCAKRKAMLQAAVNRMHWQARQIVEEANEESEPES
jgi:hypothetical protein